MSDLHPAAERAADERAESLVMDRHYVCCAGCVAAEIRAAVAEEREECATIVDKYIIHKSRFNPISEHIAKAIRARGERGDG